MKYFINIACNVIYITSITLLLLFNQTCANAITLGNIDYFNKDDFISQCDKGDALACIELGKYYRDIHDAIMDARLNFYNNTSKYDISIGFEISEDSDEALEQTYLYFNKGCDLDNAISCREAANYLSLSSIGHNDVDKHRITIKAMSLYQKGCSLKDAISCGQLGQIYYGNTGIKTNKINRNLIKAEELYQKSCDLRNGYSCTKLGSLYAGLDHIPEFIRNEFFETFSKDLDKGLSLIRRGCILEDNTACLILGDIEYKNGNLTTAKNYYKKGCNLNNPSSCISLADLYNKEDDFDTVKIFLQKACDLNDSNGFSSVSACEALARFYYSGNYNGKKCNNCKDLKNAAKFLQKACDLNLCTACNDLGNMYYRGEGIPKNFRKAFDLFTKSTEQCPLYGKAYVALGDMNYNGDGIAQDHKLASALYEKACEQYEQSCNMFEDADQCALLGELYYAGDKIKQNLKNAAMFLNKACDLKHAASCHQLAKIYEFGKTSKDHTDKININYKAAAELYEKACELGFNTDCAKAESLLNSTPNK